MNSAVEIHDSRLISITTRGDALELRLKAYIHRSEGTPGVDVGTGWVQEVILLVSSGRLEGAITEWPADLADGTLEVNGEAAPNTIPIPLDRTGLIRVTLQSTIGDSIVI